MRKGIAVIEVLVVAAVITLLVVILTSVFTHAHKNDRVSSRPAWMLSLSPRARLISALGDNGLDALDDRK